ncbi:uncharacterized protein LOC126267625 [Schistocerca gregaria]|uniref:uncharacterized protein LOC126267625 n=1 Tax=Schistocerca gregaria TaxID=7010 RepID=UPI00211E8FAE|nr:uncharacterized protein LOC126267625 [Schistocerca gregaria]
MARPAKWEKPWEAARWPPLAAPSAHATSITDVPLKSATDVCQSVVAAANDALGQLRDFLNRYTKVIHGMNFDQVDRPWKSLYVGWLYTPEEVPKSLGETLNSEYFYNISLDAELVKTYNLMQRHAVALEQLAWDHEELHTQFAQDFEDTEHRLLCVLAALDVGVRFRRLEQPRPVGREAMSFGCRQMRGPAARMRDWLILRHYTNLLEYVAQVFTGLQGHPAARFNY